MTKRAPVVAILLCAVAASASGQGTDEIPAWSADIEAIRDAIDYVWIIAASALVFLMQAGFMALESGMARAKNSINIAIKNLADFVISVAGFWVVGFGLMFGVSESGLFGTTDFFMTLGDDTWRSLFFVFQAVFVGTAATIDSGAVAERTKFGSYVLLSFITSAFIYPVFGHWAWGSFLHGTTQGWLEARGFVDFAGSTVVHSIGAWVALAGVIVVGPRIGKYNEDGTPNKIPPHNLVMVYLGTFILFFGWFGFNAGSTLGATPQIAPITQNTILAAVFGSAVAGALSWLFSPSKHPEAEMIANGLLAGLVAITAGCAYVESAGAVAIGAVAGAVVFGGSLFLERVVKLDDVVGAIPVHGMCGVWGTIATGIFMRPEFLAERGVARIRQIGIQALGSATAFAWAFPIAMLAVFVISKTVGMRVSPEAEEQGLNIAEHGASSSVIGLVTSMARVGTVDRYDRSLLVPVEEGTEVGELSAYFNSMVEALMEQQDRVERAMAEQKTAFDEISKARRMEQELRASLKARKHASDQAVRDYATGMERDVAAISRKTEEIERSIEVSVGNSARMTDSFSRVTRSIDGLFLSFKDVSESADDASQRVSVAVNEVQSTLEIIRSLTAATREIQSIILEVNELSEQTRLLSINARIEAARAGEAGRGFSVVANEVKELAETSARSADVIAQHLSAVRGNAEQSMATMDGVAFIINEVKRLHEAIHIAVSKEQGLAEDVRREVESARRDIAEVQAGIEEVRAGAVAVSGQVTDSYARLTTVVEGTGGT